MGADDRRCAELAPREAITMRVNPGLLDSSYIARPCLCRLAFAYPLYRHARGHTYTSHGPLQLVSGPDHPLTDN